MIIAQLRDIAAPELNFLLTEAPHKTDRGLDCGWFCREHCFRTAVLGNLLGLICQIVRGDILVCVPGSQRLTSIGASYDHAWCSTDHVPVLDLSLHFREHWVQPQLAAPICGLGGNGPFDIRLLPGHTSATDDIGGSPVVGYIPRNTVHATPSDLVANPQLLIPTREAGTISATVAIHIFQLFSGNTHTLAGSMSQLSALRQLQTQYPDAQAQLLALLEAA